MSCGGASDTAAQAHTASATASNWKAFFKAMDEPVTGVDR